MAIDTGYPPSLGRRKLALQNFFHETPVVQLRQRIMNHLVRQGVLEPGHLFELICQQHMRLSGAGVGSLQPDRKQQQQTSNGNGCQHHASLLLTQRPWFFVDARTKDGR